MSRLANTLSLSALPTLALLLSILVHAQQPTAQIPTAISLAESTEANIAVDLAASASSPSPRSSAGANYRSFIRTKLGESSAPQLITLEFHLPTRLTGLTASADFRIAGGSCSEGHTYAVNDRCTLDIAFTPKGPGRRLGKLTVAHSASPTPFTAYFGGTSYGPAVSFVPSQITTVPGTYKGGITQAGGGVLLSPRSLAIDNGDNLYIADTGNKLIRFIDSSGALTTLAGGGTTDPTKFQGTPTTFALNTPYGVAADPFGAVYFSDQALNRVFIINQSNDMNSYIGYGTTPYRSCTHGSPCPNAFSVAVQSPNSIATDPSGNLFVNIPYDPQFFPGSLPLEVLNSSTQLFSFDTAQDSSILSLTNPIAVDGQENFFYTVEDPGNLPTYNTVPRCHIFAQNQSQTLTNAGNTFVVAGTGPCGFTGDGGKASGAQISNNIQGFAFDAAGNFYFTDTGNNRVRRIDALTGIIRTVAGNGTTGSGGDGGPATSAAIDTPTGIAVDSQGQIYTTGYAYNAHAPGTAYQADIRRIGTIGQLNFAPQAPATSSPLQTILVSNTGNDTLNISSISITAGTASDFLINPASTTCSVTTPLFSGHNCQIGIFFKPTATGPRTAILTLYDNTVSSSNIVQLTGVGATTATLTPALLAFPAGAVGATSGALTAILKNTGTGILALTPGGISISGPNAAAFAETSTCGATLAAAASCAIAVKFTPQAPGAQIATLTVLDNAVGSLQTAALTGTGAAPAKGTLKPTSLAFSAQVVGTASGVKTIALTNSGGLSLSVSAYAFSGTNSGDFSQTHSCGATLSAGSTCGINLTFTPTAAGPRSASLSVTTNAGALTLPITGTATAAPSVKPKVTLISSSNPAPAGKAIVLTSKVIGSPVTLPRQSLSRPVANPIAGPFTTLVTGKMQLVEGNKILATANLTAGTATFHLPNLAAGTHALTAHYLGDTQHPPSTSPVFRQVVSAKP